MSSLPILYDLPEAILLSIATVVAMTGAWALADRRSQAAARLRDVWRRAGVGHLIVVSLAAAALVMIVEDVVNRRHDELVLRLDRVLQARAAGKNRAIREVASTASRLTGEGIVGAVMTGSAFLAATRRHRDALVVLVGTASAWALSAGLKMTFSITRPSARQTWYEITGYGFPGDPECALAERRHRRPRRRRGVAQRGDSRRRGTRPRAAATVSDSEG